MKSATAPRASETERSLRDLVDSISDLATVVGMKFTADDSKIRNFSESKAEEPSIEYNCPNQRQDFR